MSVPAPPSGLDLRTLRLEPAAAALRAWAAATMGELVGGADGAAAEALADLRLGAWRWPRRGLGGLERLTLRKLRLRDGESRLQDPISFLLARHLRSARRRWPWPRGRAGPAGFPVALWPLVGLLAWREPRFEKEVGGAVYERFRSSVPAPAGELPAPVLRPEVWWLVLDLVGVPGLGQPPQTRTFRLVHRVLGRRLAGVAWRLWRPWSRRIRLARRLSEIARAELRASAGWAGFWEQWLVGEALLRYGERVAEASPAARRFLIALPLLGHGRYREARDRLGVLALDENDDPRRILDPRWNHQRPSWLDLAEAPEPR